ncbi:MAG: 3-phenylpropionate MFS transporter [Deltaproteobacteria bacterium]|nr:MAG: 3-phenylpropionate MFS transporter [Deltaproteobacteria bacterium]
MGVRSRLALYYAALFAALGVGVPFWPVWLESRGLGPDAIALVLGAGQWVRIVASPAAGAYVDRSGRRRATMVGMAIIASLAFVAFDHAAGLVLFVALSALANGALIPLIPLADSLTLTREKSHGISYGSIRLWGSLSFIVASLVAGELLAIGPKDIIVWSLIAATAVTAVVALGLPDPPESRSQARPAPIGKLLRQKSFLVFLAAGAMAQASHSVYYAFGSIHWAAAGHSPTIVGALWALGVLAEVALFVVGTRLTTRFSPATLIAVGSIGGLVRWLILGSTTSLDALVVAQLLHAATFGAVHLGAMRFLSSRVPMGLAARGQTIYAAVVGGGAMGIAIPLAGPLYRVVGGAAFYYAAGFSAVALGLALVLGFVDDGRAEAAS